MKISTGSIKKLNDLNGYDTDLFRLHTEELVAKIGSQLGGVDDYEAISDKYPSAYIVKVVSAEPHPNADRLKLCLIDDGGTVSDVNRQADGLVQVVCGAPNVEPGVWAVWLPPGAVVPESFNKDPFKLEAREIRGLVSNGMLASPKELGLNENHEGLFLISSDFAPGTLFKDAFNLSNDVLIELENKMFTHRPDCFGYLGIARELAGIQGLPYKSPDWYRADVEISTVNDSQLGLNFINELPSLVPRFTAAVVEGVTVGPSPDWLQIELAKIGLRSVNNVVDLTNLYMIWTGQPLHAYDYDKVASLSQAEATLVVRYPRPNEEISLLNGKTLKPRPEAIMIATDKQLIGVGGVMGGSATEVDSTTKRLIVECANFDMYSVRRTSMEHGLFTDAVTRFTKGQSPLQNKAVLKKILEDISSIGGGKSVTCLVDNNHIDEMALKYNSLHPPVEIEPEFIRSRLGLTISKEEIKQLLINVEFKVEDIDSKLKVTAPFWRTDIELREDLVEEVGRLYGYDKLPLSLPLRSIAPVTKDPLVEAKEHVRNLLSSSGANEVLTYSFIHGDLIEKVGQEKDSAFEVANALRPELQFYRLSLLPSLADKVHPNIKAGYDRFALFEIGKTHSRKLLDETGLPIESENTALIVARSEKTKQNSSAFYEAKLYLTQLCPAILLFEPIKGELKEADAARPFDVNRSAVIKIKDTNEILGYIGEFKQSVRSKLKLPAYCAGFEINTFLLADMFKKAKVYRQLPKFPPINQDLSLKVSATLNYQVLYETVHIAADKEKPSNCELTIEPLDIYQSASETDHKHVTFRLRFASHDRTLTDKEINKVMDKVSEQAKKEHGAERI